MERPTRPPADQGTAIVRQVCLWLLMLLGLGLSPASWGQNTPPTIVGPGDLVVGRNSPSGLLPFTVGDAEDAPTALVVTAASGNPVLVPVANITLAGTGANRTVNVNPVNGVSGQATITLTVTDTANPAASASASFVVTVNDAPTLSSISNRTIDEDTSTGVIPFTVGDTESDPADLTVTASSSSSNAALLPSGSIVLGGSGVNRTLTITPATHENGSATITLTVTDEAGRTDTESLTLTVRPVNDRPTLAGEVLGSSANPVLDTDTGVLLFANLTVADVDQGRPGSETLTVTVTNSATTLGMGTFTGTGVINDSTIVVTGTPAEVTAALRAVAFQPTPNRVAVGQDGVFHLAITVQDAGGLAASNSGESRSVSVRSANDAPVLAVSVVPASVPDLGDSSPFRLGITDPDPFDDTLPYVVVLEPVSDPGFSFGSLVPASPTNTGSVAQVEAWVRSIVFRPIGNSVASSQTVTFRFRVTDAHGGEATQELVLTLTGQNDVPEILGVSANVLRLTDDPGQSPFHPFAQVRIQDPDANASQGQTVMISIDDPGKGSLSATTLTGTPAEVTDLVRAIVFTPIQRPGRALGETVNAVLTLRVEDALGASRVNAGTVLAITSVDGAPVIQGVPAIQPLALSPAPPVKPFAGFTVTDDDAAASITVVITLDVPEKGRLTGLVGTGGSFAEDPAGSGRYVMSAPASAVTEVLTNLVFEVSGDYVFPPSNPGGTIFRLEATDAALNTRTEELAVVLENAPRNHRVVDDSDALNPEDHPNVAERGRARLGTLRRAVEEAGNNDVITFDLPSYPALIRLDSALGALPLRRHVTLKGPGADLLTLSGDTRGDRNRATRTRLLDVQARVTVEGITLADGFAVSGGAIQVSETGDLRLRYCAVVDSTAVQWGGAIDVDGGTVSIANCLFRDNATDASLGLGGGAISIFSSLDSLVRNSTFSRNRQEAANGFGGGAIYVELDDPAAFLEVGVEHCTFAENRDGSDRASSIMANVLNTVVTVKNSVFADARGRNLGVQGAGQIVSEGGNVSDDSTRVVLTQAGVPKAIILLNRTSDRAPAQPLLRPFDARDSRPVGGYPLTPGSPAVGRAVTSSLVIDQRGALRDTAPDAGAMELAATGRVVLNEIQHTGSPTDFLEFYVLRDSDPFDLGGYTVWVDGVLRHEFRAGTLVRPGAGVIVSDDLSLAVAGGTPVQQPETNGIITTLGIGLRGLVEVRTPGTSGRLVTSASYVGVYADPQAPSQDLNLGNRSITLRPQFRGFAFVPHPGPDDQTPGSDSDGTPFGSPNAFPGAADDEYVVGEDDLARLSVLDNDLDADGSDRPIIVDLSSVAGVYGNDATATTAASASVSVVDPAAAPPRGLAVVYDPRGSASLQSLPEGVERTDRFYYTVVDVGAGEVLEFRADPSDAGVTVVLSTNHRLAPGQVVELTGAGEPAYDGFSGPVTVLNENEFSLAIAYASNPTVKGSWRTALSLSDGAIVSYAGSPGQPPVIVNSPGHGLTSNDGVVIQGSSISGYNGLHVVTVVSADEFSIPAVFDGNPASLGSWSSTRSRIPTRVSQGEVRLTVIGANDPPAPVADVVHGEEETLLRIFGDPVLPAIAQVSAAPTFDTDDEYPMVPAFARVSLLPNDDDIDDDDDATTLRIVGVLSRVFAVAGYSGTPGAIGVTVESAAHGLASGDVILLSGYGGHPSYNRFHTVTVLDADHFTLPILYVDNHPTAGRWAVLNDANRSRATSELGAELRLEIRVDRIETSIVYNPLTSEYLDGLAAGETGTDTFHYAVQDSHGAVSFAAVTVLVAGRNDPPQPVIDPPSLGDLPPGTSPEVLLSGATVNFHLPPASQTPGRADVEITVGTAPSTTTLTLADLWSTDEDTALRILTADVVGNDTDVDRSDVSQNRLRVKAVARSSSRLGAALTLDAANGWIEYDPSPALNALVREEAVLDTFEVVITDDQGSDVNSLVAVLVVGRNDRPDALDDSATTPEDTSITLRPQDNDVDPDINGVPPDNQLRIIPRGPLLTAQGALLTLTPESLVYDPSGSEHFNSFAVGYSETELVPYTVTDGSFIFANDDLFKVEADGSSFELAVMANDANLSGSGGALRIVGVGTPSRGGTVVVNGAQDGLVYTPPANHVGDEVFPYTVSDEDGNTDRAFVVARSNVDTLNGNLQANPDAYSVALGEESVLDVLANDNVLPASGGGLIITRLLTQPATDRVELRGNRIAFIQTNLTAGYSVSFDYEISGGGTARARAKVEVRVVDRRGTLAVRPDAFSLMTDSTATPLEVLANDHILPGAPVVLAVSRITTAPVHGAAEISPDGRRVLYTPNSGYVGLDSFAYEAIDGLGGTGATTVALAVGSLTTSIDFFSAPFDDPGASDHAVKAILDVLANDRVLQSDPATLEILSVSPGTTTLGTMEVAPDRKTLWFDPAVGQEGEATFVYTLRDGETPGRTAQGTVTVVVLAEGVQANPDFYSVDVGSAENRLVVLSNDAAIPDRGRRLSVVGIGTGLDAPNRGGAVRVSENGDAILYTPAPGYSGEETFTYSMTDSRSTDTAKVVVRVVSGALSANDDAFTVFYAASAGGERISFVLPVVANDRVSPDAGQVLRITGVGIDDTVNEPNAPDQNGEVRISADGTSLIYTPHQTLPFTLYREHFTYEITDGTARRAQGHVEVEVQWRDNVRDMETHDDFFSVERDSIGNALRVLANDDIRPAAAAGWVITSVSPTTYGGVVSVRRDTVLYTPRAGFVGTDVFTYAVSDGAGGTGSATVRVKVGDLPLCPDVFAVLSGSTDNSLDVLANDAIRPEVPGASFHLTGIGSAPTRGTASISDGRVLYTPTGAGPYPYVDKLVYEVVDDSGQVFGAEVTIHVHETGTDRDTAVVRITVTGVNDAPLILGTRCCFEVYQRGSVQPFAGVTFVEFDRLPAPEVLTLEIVVSDRTHGYLTDGTTTQLDPDGDGRYVFTGTAEQLTALVRTLAFVPTVGDPSRLVAGGSEETRFTLRLSDTLVTVTDDITTVITRHPEVTRLSAPDGASGDEFGYSVGASRRTVVSGAPFDDDSLIQGSGNKTGSAYLYDRDTASPNAWGYTAKVFAEARAIGDQFGYSTDVDGSGTVMAAGARSARTGSVTTGAAYIFRREADGEGGWRWAEKARLGASPLASGDRFGHDIALNEAGDVVVVGAPSHRPAGSVRTGAAFVFARTSSAPEAWGLVATLTPSSGSTDDEFGRSVSIQGDLIAVGAPRHTPTNKKSGAVHLFRRTPAGTGSWGFLVRLTPAAGDNGDEFGHSVAVHGTWLAVGARLDEANGKKSGTTYVFKQSPTVPATWTQTAMLQSGLAGADDEYGYSVAIDDQFLVVGARREGTAGRRAGAIHIHGRDHGGPAAWGRLERLIPSTVDLDDEFGFSVAMRQGLVAVGARRQQLDGRRFGSTYVYQLRYNNAPLLRGELPDALAYLETPFQYQVPVALFADGDLGDSIVRFEARQTNGQPLPGWLSFDPLTGLFSSTSGPSPLDAGVLDLRVTAFDWDDVGVSGEFELRVEAAASFVASAVSSPSQALAWSLEHARTVRIPASTESLRWLGPGMDPDGDGVSNLGEYARASDPFVADGEGEAGRVAIETDETGEPVVRVRRRSDDPRLVYILESSADLSHWTPVRDEKVQERRQISGRVEEARYRGMATGAEPARYFRVRMEYR